MKFSEKAASRKFIIMASILIFGVFALITPALLAYIGVAVPALLTGSEFVSLTVGSFGIYSGANVWQKKINPQMDSETENEKGNI